MIALLRRLFCRHRHQSFVRNIYGDEIFLAGGKRSVWECVDCASHRYRDALGNCNCWQRTTEPCAVHGGGAKVA